MYGAVSAALLVVIATVALVLKPPSPPALAEFAPQVEEAIDDTSQQSSRFGTGGGGECAAGQLGCEGVGNTTTTTGVEGDEGTPSTTPPRQAGTNCVGSPPRQTEDPQSPPCVQGWTGDNGGATSMGVTRDEIRVTITTDGSAKPEHFSALAGFFNRRFVLYGRSITVVPVSTKNRESPSPEAQQLAAGTIAEQRPFASLFSNETSTVDRKPFRTRLAAAGVVSILPDDDFATEELYRELHPYAWNYGLSFDRMGRDLAEMVCRSMAGRNAAHAGPDLRANPRSFAVLLQEANADWAPPDAETMVAALRSCDVPLPLRVERFRTDTAASGNAARRLEWRQLMDSLRDDGVTTVVPVGHQGGLTHLMTAATDAGFQPEWLLPGGGETRMLDEAFQQATQRTNPDQIVRLMAVGAPNKLLAFGDRPSTWAAEETGVYVAQDSLSTQAFEDAYRSLLLLASGIQAAGPRLTPETFARGLQSLRFPNPGAGAGPYYQASVGFTGDHTMVDDEGLWWWNPAAPSYYMQGTGTWCYIDQGARWRAGQWPRREMPFFDTGRPCR